MVLLAATSMSLVTGDANSACDMTPVRGECMGLLLTLSRKWVYNVMHAERGQQFVGYGLAAAAWHWLAGNEAQFKPHQEGRWQLRT